MTHLPEMPYRALTEVIGEAKSGAAMSQSLIQEGASAPASPWFAVQLKPNAEAIARRNLAQQGINVFAPFEVVTVRRGQRLAQVNKSLFPGYLFVSFDREAMRWRTINSTYGVSRLVSFGSEGPAEVPLELIEALRQRCDGEGRLIEAAQFARGDQVRLVNGPFADFVGTIDGLNPEQRVWVLLDVLGKSTRVTVKASDLRLAG